MYILHFSMGQTIPRIQALDILPSIIPYNAELFIKKVEDQEISWTVYLKPISTKLWIMLVFVAIVISIVLTSIEKWINKSQSQKLFFKNLLTNLWIALKANFGGKPGSIIKNFAYQIVIFSCLLVGSIFWMAYRASLTSELAVVNFKLPFDDLESLLVSDYR